MADIPGASVYGQANAGAGGAGGTGKVVVISFA